MSGTLNVNIPCEIDSLSKTYALNLYPSLEKNSWDLTLPSEDNRVIENIDILFESAKPDQGIPLILETQQKAIFIITLQSSDDEPNDPATNWSFFGNGVETLTLPANCQYDLSSEQLDPHNLKLVISQVNGPNTYQFDTEVSKSPKEVIKIERTEKEEEESLNIEARFSLLHIPSNSLYMSQDPGLSSRR